jgi:hypothetical protein
VLDIRPRPLFRLPYNDRGAEVKGDVHPMNAANLLNNNDFQNWK